MRQFTVAFVTLLAAQSAAARQPQGPEFDVVSVRPSQGADNGRVGAFRQGGRWRAVDVTLVRLIETAYPEYANRRVVDGPAWARDSRFTIEATVSASPTAADVERMIRRLLEERFSLRVHAEKRMLDVYALRVAREDGRLGPNLVPSARECVSAREQREVPPARCERFQDPGTTLSSLTAHVSPISRIVQMLTAVGADRPVVDHTGLTGRYDIQLLFRGGFAPNVGADLDDAPLLTALEEQLGLKLERRREVLNVLVIDAASPPQPD